MEKGGNPVFFLAIISNSIYNKSYITFGGRFYAHFYRKHGYGINLYR